eukprot:CAMPEP_0177309810 /NCGR_PEP_ID=MMETSP0368-20130122/9503_1 /TAXON_ID=447022 ORGANISM="Scrippsiella hangoei-like, Strain SHHI-4" /NCGR_SAMPLE_ID=MMETSP0368 /ASSEMBLY_ACC=CAM_ASM_000363 /LENGTH=236 /DNA_ID=CAMNT_0018768725 /DNA_START=75 /DNA_END=782 /DNA_ORIENTATION=+
MTPEHDAMQLEGAPDGCLAIAPGVLRSEWIASLNYLLEVRQLDVLPDAISYNKAINECGKAQQVQQACGRLGRAAVPPGHHALQVCEARYDQLRLFDRCELYCLSLGLFCGIVGGGSAEQSGWHHLQPPRGAWCMRVASPPRASTSGPAACFWTCFSIWAQTSSWWSRADQGRVVAHTDLHAWNLSLPRLAYGAGGAPRRPRVGPRQSSAARKGCEEGPHDAWEQASSGASLRPAG